MFENYEYIDLCVVAFAATLIFLVVFNHKNRLISRLGSVLILLLYAFYLSFRMID